MKKYLIYIIPILFVLVLLRSNSIQATTELETGTYTIESCVESGFVFDVEGLSEENQANVQLWENAETKNQQFKIEKGTDGYYTILAIHSNKALEAAGAGMIAGTNVQQYTSNGTDAQKWDIKYNSDGTYTFVSKCNGLSIDINSGLANNGANVQVFTDNGTKAQKFKLIKHNTVDTIKPEKTLENGTYSILSNLNTKYSFDVEGASQNNQANIQLWENVVAQNQLFNFESDEEGYYTITSLSSGKALEVAGAGMVSGTNVQQYTSNGTDAQKWIITYNKNDETYTLTSKCNGLCIDVYNGEAKNGGNIQVFTNNNTNAQKFKIQKYKKPTEIPLEKSINTGIYTIKTAANSDLVLDVAEASQENQANIQLWGNASNANQMFRVKYISNGYYTITAMNSKKALEAAGGGVVPGTNVQQYTSNGTDAQQWIIVDQKDGQYKIYSKCSKLPMSIAGEKATNGSNVELSTETDTTMQKFIFEKIDTTIKLDTNKYPGYKEQLDKLLELHPNWNFEFLYTGLNFSDAVAGEYEVRSANLVPTSYGGEWISGTTLYDTGWYGASEKAIARFMDPRNFLNEIDVFQFQDVNDYLYGVCTLEGIQEQVNNSFLKDYATDIDTACRNENVNPYYIIARLFQENGKNPKNGTYKMNGGDGKYYYNPFNIGATGNSTSEVYNNALARAKREGWDTMVKALQGGIYFCKKNWLENYQNTLYQNKFDIDSTNGTSLYSHQYMQNLFGAYNEAKSLRGMYNKTGKIDSEFTFIIPLYENMPKELSPEPSNNQESYVINVRTTGTQIRIRKEASTDSDIVREIEDAGTVLLSVQRGINSNWHKVVTPDGLIGYVSGTYLEQIDDVKTCNYSASVKTNDGDGCYIRIGPSTSLDKITGLSDGTYVTVIDDSTYKNINGYDWSRIVLSNGTQAFMPSKFLSR